MIEEVQTPTRRKKTNYVSTVVAITLLLFVLGLSVHFVFQSAKLSAMVKEQQAIRVELSDDADIELVKQSIAAKDYVKEIKFISKEEGWKAMKNEMNHDASLLLDENPLPNLIIIHVKADRNSPAQISEHSQGLKKLSGVETVDFKEADLKLLDKIISKLTLAGFILIAFLFLVTIYIIASTIRLAIFSQRFIIRSMQLVGATRWFIVRPFVHKSIFNGVLSGLCASAMITGLYFLIEYYFPSWNVFQPIMYYVISLVLMIIVGVILTVLSSLIMVRRYLRMKLDELY